MGLKTVGRLDGGGSRNLSDYGREGNLRLQSDGCDLL
jgi:hypothetical protein